MIETRLRGEPDRKGETRGEIVIVDVPGGEGRRSRSREKKKRDQHNPANPRKNKRGERQGDQGDAWRDSRYGSCSSVGDMRVGGFGLGERTVVCL